MGRDYLAYGLGITAMNLRTKSLLLLAVAVTRTYGMIYDDVSQLPTYDYDYLIVGGTSPLSLSYCKQK